MMTRIHTHLRRCTRQPRLAQFPTMKKSPLLSLLALAAGPAPAAQTDADPVRVRLFGIERPSSVTLRGAEGAVALEADGRVYHNAGATEAQELGAMLSLTAGHLRMFEEARQPLLYAAPHIGFCLSADQDQFMTMAKIRAMRLLWTRLQEACSIAPSAASIHAETSMRMMTKRDAETNMLRSTIACFAAAAGGADTISALPHSIAHGLPDAFARRLARNTQLVLAQEAHIGFVSDPGSGSGSIEALTDTLCEAAWAEFQAIEAEGGILHSLLDGRFQIRVKASRDRRAQDYQSGKRVLIGSTLYPAKEERPVTVLTANIRPMPTDGSLHCERLDVARIEELAGAAA